MRRAGWTVLLALVFLSRAVQGQQFPPLAPEVAEAQEDVLAKLPASERDIALALSRVEQPRIDYMELPRLKRGEVGELALRRGEGARAILRPMAPNDARFLVSQVVDDGILIAKGRVWIEGIDASELTDDSLAKLGGVLFITLGPKRYTTVLGASRSVPGLAAIDAETVAAAEELRALRTFRTWSDESGRFTVLAKFVAFKRGQVTLEKLDGKQSAIPLTRLSKDDQAYVRELVKSRTLAGRAR